MDCQRLVTNPRDFPIDLPGAPTAPNRIASYFRSVVSASSGMYFPVLLYESLFQSKLVNLRSNVFSVSANFLRTVMPASITSGPMPSAGIDAMR